MPLRPGQSGTVEKVGEKGVTVKNIGSVDGAYTYDAGLSIQVTPLTLGPGRKRTIKGRKGMKLTFVITNRGQSDLDVKKN